MTNPRINMLDFKIKSLDFALQSEHFNFTQKLQMLKLQDELVFERSEILKQDTEE